MPALLSQSFKKKSTSGLIHDGGSDIKILQLDRPTLMYFISLQSKSRKQQYLNVMITEGH